MRLINNWQNIAKQYLKLTILLALVAIAWSLQSGKSLALLPPPGEIYSPPSSSNIPSLPGHEMPNPNDFSQGNDVFLVVARCDPSTPACTGPHQLQNLSSTVRLFVNTAAGFTFYVNDGDAPCGSQDDISTSNNTNFTMTTMNYQGDGSQDPWGGGTGGHSIAIGPRGSNILTGQQAGCGQYKVSIPGSSYNDAKEGSGQYAGWYGLQFTATLTSGIGWNSFKLSSDIADFSYYSNDSDTNADHFALKSIPNSGRGSFTFPFAPNCSDDGTNTYYLKWFDADAGEANQGTDPVVTYLYGYNRNTGATSTKEIDITTGNNVGGSVAVNLTLGWIYAWKWTAINDDNGVQVKLPFDSFNAYREPSSFSDCGNSSPSVGCTATPSPASVTPGGSSTITVQGFGNVKWVADGGSGYYIKRINATDYPSEKNDAQISGSNPYTNVVHPQPPSGSSSVTYTYSVYNSSGNTVPGATCKATVTVAYFVTQCGNTAVDKPIGSYYIVWKDSSGTVSPIYPFTITAGSGKTFNTFSDFTSLWPDKIYTGTLYTGVYPNGTNPISATLQAAPGVPCLQFTGCSASISPSSPEPGQLVHYIFNVTYTNSTGWNWPVPADSGDQRKYYGLASANPGAYIGPTTPEFWQVTGTGTQIKSFNTQYTGHIDYTGSYDFKIVPGYDTSHNLLPAACPGSAGGTITPHTQPYFQVWNSGVSAGGGFASPSGTSDIRRLGTCGGSGDPPYVTADSSNQYYGGVQAFGAPYAHGSMADFGAVAMGLIPDDPADGVGFYAGGTNHNAMFANSSSGNPNSPSLNFGSNPPGGTLYGNASSGNGCVKDYFDDFQSKTEITSLSPPSIDLNSAISDANTNHGGRWQYLVNGSVSSIGGVPGVPGAPINVPAGTQITLFVNGDLTIDQNILAASTFNPSDKYDAPYLAIVVSGSITVEPGVTELDGLFVAQPHKDLATGNYSGGTFRTCPANTACTNQLVINGAVIAQQVDLLRIHGTVTPPGAYVGNAPAEIINLPPSMVIGAPAFTSQYGSLDDIYNLPPVF